MTKSRKPLSFDSSLQLNFKYNVQIAGAYVITLQGNPDSERLAQRCLDSCRAVTLPAQQWAAFDGTSGTIKTPTALQNKDYLKWIKVIDPYLSPTEVACALSHFSLWALCLELDQPLVVLEHDAVVVAPYSTHPVFGCITYLGCREQMQDGWPVLPTPPHATHGNNFHFLCRAHAYSIDPAIAKTLVAHVLRSGIHESLDMMLRADLFPIVQLGLVAYDDSGGLTTITDRKPDPFGQER